MYEETNQTQEQETKADSQQLKEWLVVKHVKDVQVYSSSKVAIVAKASIDNCQIFGGELTVRSGGKLFNCIVNAGTLIVQKGAVATRVLIKKGAKLVIQTGGQVHDLKAVVEFTISPYPGAVLTMAAPKARASA